MRFLITNDAHEVLAEVHVPADDIETIAIERADRPELLIAEADPQGDGTVTVGHWLKAEDWETCLRTAGVPLSPDVEMTPAKAPGPPSRPRRRPRPPRPARATLCRLT
jgi:hypothetical protein